MYEATNEQMERGLEAIRSHLPPWVVSDMKKFSRFPFRPFPKLLMIGGTIAGLFVAPAGLAVGMIGALQEGSALIAGDP